MGHDKKCMRWRKQFKWLLKIPVCMILRESALRESLAGHWVPINLGKEKIPSFLPLNYNPFTYNVNALTMVRFWNLKCFWNLKWNSEMLLIWPPDQATKHTQRAQRKVEKQEGQFWGQRNAFLTRQVIPRNHNPKSKASNQNVYCLGDFVLRSIENAYEGILWGQQHSLKSSCSYFGLWKKKSSGGFNTWSVSGCH